MVFPDYGPLRGISQFTQDGFAQGSFLFQLFAGEVAATQALHFVGLMFALIGAIAIVFLKQFHNVKTIASWTFLVLILLIGPRNNTFFFTEIPVNTEYSPGTSEVYAYSPQAVVIDLMSKIHKAIYLSFFDVSAPGEARMRNIIEDMTESGPVSNSRNTSLNERNDIKQEISAYNILGCGKAEDLSLPLYDPQWQGVYNTAKTNILFDDINTSPYHYSIEETYKLQQKTFTVTDLHKVMEGYETYRPLAQAVIPPFGVVFEDEDVLEDVYTNAGVEASIVAKMKSDFVQKDQDFIADKESSFSWFLTKRQRVVDGIATADLNQIGPTAALEDPTLSAFVVTTDGLDNIGITDAIDDPVEDRMEGDIYSSFEDDIMGNELWTKQVIGTDFAHKRSSTPVAIAFMTPNLRNTIYKSRAEESIGASGKRDLTNLANMPILNVVTNCAQLHTMVHNRIRDAIVFQNAWPAHKTNVSIEGSTVNPGSFIEYFGMDVMNSPTNYVNFPYNDRVILNPNLSMVSANRLIQSTANTLVNEISGTVYTPFLGAITGGVGSEITRRGALFNAVKTTFLNSNISSPHSAQVRDALNGGSDNLSVAMRDSMTTDSIKKNFPSVAGGVLQTVTEKVASWGSAIASQFAGIGAVAFIRFLQIFIGVALFFILMCTPIIYMMGILIPAQAPGVIIVSLISIVALKAIPIGFTLVDAVMTLVMKRYSIYNIGEDDFSIMLYVTAAAYTSVTMVTFFLLFKAGDSQTVLGQMSQMDSKANEIAESAAKFTKDLAIAVAAAGTAVVTGGAGAVMAGKGAGTAGKIALTQGREVFGKRGAGALPGVGTAAQEITGSYREGKGQAQVMGEIDSNNKDIDAKVSTIDAQLSGTAEMPKGVTTESLQSEKSDLMSQRKSYDQHMRGYGDAQAQEKYRSKVRGAQDHWAAGRAEDKFEKSAGSQNMTTQEARRSERDARAESAVNSTLGAAVQAKELQVKGDVTLENVEMSATAARSIQMGQLQADRTYKQANSDASTTQRLAAVQDELKQQTSSTLATEVEGKAAKQVKSDVTVYEYNDDGSIKSSRAVPQDPMYDQAAGELKKTLEGTPEFASSSPTTRKNATELTTAKQLAEHSRGTYTDTTGNQQDFKLELQPEVAQVLEKHGQLDRVTNSRNAGDLWVDPQSPMYNELRELKNADGKQMFDTMEGHSVSLFNHHIQNDQRAKKMATDIMKDTNLQISSIKRND